ncbi:MAG: hypothetical protein VW625_04970, partial [Perlucidibaca sp.]
MFSPKSIFVSIYGGILVVVVTVSLCTYGVLRYVNAERAQSYTERMSTALFHITAVAVARQDDYSRALWVQDAAQLMGAPLRLLAQLPFEPSRREQARLDQGYAVVRMSSRLETSEVYI